MIQSHPSRPALGYLLLRRLRWPLVTLLSVYAITILGFTLVPGQDGDGNPWRMDFFHAFYFVSFMGSTIGFGEIPYEFTTAQRAWAIVGIYGTVIAWLYGIGALMATMQDPMFRRVLREQQFRRKVARLREPFYIICGYGDTGSMLVKALCDDGIRTVVIDNQDKRIEAMILDELPVAVPAIQADASATHVLESAGLLYDYCRGVVAITDTDQINLTIALTAHLLRPEVKIIARAETRASEANISSFGSNTVINPFNTFAGRLAMAVHSPSMFILHEWMTGVPNEPLRDHLSPPRGNWILCGYGRFGRAIQERLNNQGVSTVLVDPDADQIDADETKIVGTGTEAQTLLQAGIMTASGIVAGTANDADNLSILLTAKELNPRLFSVARQNDRRNEALFARTDSNTDDDTAKPWIDLVMRRGSVIAHKIYASIRTPMLDSFLTLAKQQDSDWANRLIARVVALADDQVPHIWELTVSPSLLPSFYELHSEHSITIGNLMRNPRQRESPGASIALLLQRGQQQTLLPDEFTPLQSGDKLLFCGHQRGHAAMNWIARNPAVLSYIISGIEHPSTYLGRWIDGWRHQRAVSKNRG